MNVNELLSFKPTSSSRETSRDGHQGSGEGVGSRKRPRLPVPSSSSSGSSRENNAGTGILKKAHLSSEPPIRFDFDDENGEQSSRKSKGIIGTNTGATASSSNSNDMEISEEERMRILELLESEPEVTQLDDTGLRRMISVLDKRIAKNQEMRIKFPDQPEKFMESELELHESIQELHSLATMAHLYNLAVDLNLPSILLGCLSHENADISCAVLNLLQELSDLDTVNEAEEETAIFIDNLLDQQAISLLTQNLDRLDEANKDEADGVHNTLAIFENLFELRATLCSQAGQNGLLQWLLKRIKARVPFDGNKLYAGEVLAILLQDTEGNRTKLGDLEGIDIVLQQLAAYKRHDPSTNEEAEYMENLFNCLCSALMHGSNRDKFLKGEGPQLMNLMLREKKQSRSGALKVLDHAVSGPDGTLNAHKVVEILGLRTIFPLFMKTPKKAKRKGLSALEHEEHVISIIASILQHTTGPTRNRVLIKFEESDFEKVERLGELHFKYLEKVNGVDQEILNEIRAGGERPNEDEIYLRRLENGLFTLQLIDYIILETCVSQPKVKERLKKIIQLRRGSVETVKQISTEYANNLGDENKEWRAKQQENIKLLIEQF